MEEIQDTEDIDLQPTKRFRHQSYHQQLKSVHLPSTFKQTQYEEEIGDNDSHFHEALDHWRQLNLSPWFIQFVNQADSMSMSMPLLLHNWKEIIDLWITAMESSDDEGLRALLDLLQKMAHDLRTTLAPVYDDIITRLLKLLARSISPEALTVLLETFNTLFRFLLVPHTELLQSTWTAIKTTLPKCLPEIQRAMAEVWGSVLRKLKSAAREQAVRLLAESAEGVDDASAWVLVFACKSVSQTLHTATPSIITPLLTYHLEAEDPEPTFSIIRRSFTALIHHVKNAEQFSSLGNLVVQHFKTTVKSGTPSQISRILDVATILCSVRQGSRLTDAHKTALFSEMETLELTPSLLSFGVSLYTSTEMALWISQGMKFLQRAWASDFAFALKFNGALAELGWGGWKLVALPLVLKSTAKDGVLTGDVFSFLARVRKARKLSSGETDLVWRTRLEKAAVERLGEVGAEQASEVSDIFALVSFYSAAITPVIVSLIETFLNAPSTPETASWILGSALEALAKRPKEEWSGVDPRKWASIALERWSAYPALLEAMVELSNELPSSKGTGKAVLLPFSSAYETLSKGVGSYSRVTRLAALRFMTAPNLVNLDSSSGEEDQGLGGSSVKDVLKRCLQGEEASLDVQGVRERVLRIGRVGQVVGDKVGAEVCARWLVAQLKVNLRPLWSPATAALAGLAGRFGDVVWELLFSELKEVQGGSVNEGEGEGVAGRRKELGQEKEEDEINESERSWRDPSAHKFRVAVGHWLDDEYHKSEFAKSRQVSERFDRVTYEYQLLTTLGECSTLVEKHNRELVPYFLSLAQPDEESDSIRQNRTSLPKQKLVLWFTLFSKFQNPKALYSTQTLRTLYINSLSHPFRPLQRVALDCLFTYKSPALPLSRQETLKTLLDDTRWRDELTNLDLSNLGTNEQERGEVMNVLIRLLFGLMLEKKARGKSGGGADRRAAVLGALGGCSEEELGLLVDLMLMPLGVDSRAHAEEVEAGKFELAGVGNGVNGRQVVGYLTLLGDVMRLLGSRLVRYWPAMLGTTLDIVSFAQRKIEEEVQGDVDMYAGEDAEKDDAEKGDDEGGDEKELSSKTLRSIRQVGLKRLADFFKVPIQFQFEPYLEASVGSIISPRLEAFARENIQSASATLDLLHVWSNDHTHAFYLVKYDSKILPALWDCLVAQNVKPLVVERIFDVIERVVGYAEIDERARDEILKPHVELLLTNLAVLVERTRGGQSKVNSGSLSLALTTPLGQRHLAILSSLSPFATSPSQATTLVGLFLPLLKKPNKQVPEKVKANILVIIKDMMGLVPDLAQPNSALWGKMFGTLSTLFSTLRTRVGRCKLVEAFARIEEVVDSPSDGAGQSAKEWLNFVSTHLAQLNAYSTKRMDEPDFDKRLAAYSAFNDDKHGSEVMGRVPLAWSPVLYQAFSDIQDVEELALRIAAGQTMRRFVEKVAATSGEEKEKEGAGYEGTYAGVFLGHFLPSLRSTLSTPLQAQGPNATSSFAVKSDLLAVLSYTVSHAPATLSPTIAALQPLLEDGDEEANFFNNLLHIQIHRRTRALRRLGERCDKGEFAAGAGTGGSNAVVREWLLPTVTWFIGTGSSFMKTQTNQHKEDQSNHLTTNEAIQTLGKLAGYLGWSPYYGLVQRYLKMANGNDEWEKIYVRTIVSILENFNFEMKEEEVAGDAMEVDAGNEVEVEEEGVVGEDGQAAEEEQAKLEVKVAPGPRRKANILASVKGKLLPSLLAYLSPPSHKFNEDQTPLTVRLPVALAIARLTLRLPGTTTEDRAKKQTEMRRLATELSHMMKSRSQEVRDAVRDVLGKIALTVLGLDGGKTEYAVDDFDADSYLNVLVEELQTALLRGPQLHILATTVNSIIAKVVAGIEGRAQPKTVEEESHVKEEGDAEMTDKNSPTNRPLLLDEVVPAITTISSTILFGDVSSNPDANNGGAVPVNHVSATFREPRQSMNASYSLYAFASQYSSPSVLPELLRDVKGVMGVTSNLKTMTVVDEVLRRVGGGLERNKGIEKAENKASDSDWLVNVIWGLVSGNVAFLKEREDWNNPKKKGKKGANKPKNDFVVQRSRNVTVETDQYAHNSYRFIVLGLDLLHTALRRGRFANANATVYKQLDALLPVLGNSLYSTSTPVLLHALKCVALLVTKFPIVKLPGMRRALPVYVNQVLHIIKTSGGGGGNLAGADGDLMKGALRTLGTIVRDGPKSSTTPEGVIHPGVDLKEKDLTFLLELVAPDLEDPDKQGVAFALLRAIVSRRFVVPEMYDIMEDQVAPLLVQSQSNTVREQARALLLQFMLDYPQGKGRLQKTLAFLLRNASSYVHESGRSSILELLSAVLTKFQSGLITEYGEMIFVSLVMVLANDESAKCREAAAHLVATLYGRFSETERKNIVRTWLKKWVKAGIEADGAGAAASGKRKLAWIALQVWGVVIEAAAKEDADGVQAWLGDAVEDVSQGLQQSESLMAKKLAGDAEDDTMDVDGAGPSKDDVEWQLPYYALSTFGKALSVSPALARTEDSKKSANSSVPWSLVTAHLLFPHAWVRTAACRTLGQLFNAYPIGSNPQGTLQTVLTSPAFDAENPLSVGPLRDVAAKLCEELKSEHLDAVLGLQVVKNLLWIARIWLIQADEDAPPALEEDEESDGEDEEAALEAQGNLGNLPWLFSKLSYQIRGSLIRRKGRHGRTSNWSQQPLAAVRWFAAMATYMAPARLEKFLTHILSPVYRIIEEDTIQDQQMDELRTTATELRELVQQKVGGTVFSTTYNAIRQKVLEVRRERKTKRLVTGTLDPAKAAKRKEKKTLLKKESRKRKERSFADARGGIKRRKEY